MTLDEKIAFMIGKGADDVPVLVMGIPRGAWEYMKDGHTHTFDLTKAGLQVKLILYGGEDHAGVMDVIKQYSVKMGVEIIDERGKDFSV